MFGSDKGAIIFSFVIGIASRKVRIGVAVFANKQLTVFPEAVRAELLERVLGPSVGAGPARVRARQQPAWRARVRAFRNASRSALICISRDSI